MSRVISLGAVGLTLGAVALVGCGDPEPPPPETDRGPTTGAPIPEALRESLIEQCVQSSDATPETCDCVLAEIEAGGFFDEYARYGLAVDGGESPKVPPSIIAAREKCSAIQ